MLLIVVYLQAMWQELAGHIVVLLSLYMAIHLYVTFCEQIKK